MSTPSDAAVTVPVWVTGGGGGGTSGSASSLPELMTLPPKPRGHERTSSYDVTHKIQRKPSGKGSSTTTSRSSTNRSSVDSFPVYPGSPTSMNARRDSRTSLQSTISRGSNLTSPVLRRLSSQISMQREGSTASMSSEQYMSAVEDISDENCPLSDPRQGLLRQTSAGSDSRSQSPPYSSLGDVSWSSRAGDRTMETVFEATVPSGPGSSSSSSVSSFESALSEQDASKPDVLRSILRQPRVKTPSPFSSEEDIHQNTQEEVEEEDELSSPPTGPASFIDLHGQINQPITKSPLLMSCYMTHMTQLQCSHWTATPPQPHGKKSMDPDATLTPGQSLFGGEFTSGIPQYSYTKEGFTPNLMVNKKEPKTPPGFHSPGPLPESGARHFFPDADADDFSPG